MWSIRSGNPNRSIIRGIFSIAIGLTIIVVPDLTLPFVIRVLGAFLLIDGLVALLINYFSKNQKSSPFLIVPRGTTSLIFGAILVLFPSLMVNMFVFFLGFILLIAGLTQLINQITGRSLMGTSWIIIIISLISISMGVFFIAKPFESAQTMLIIFGVMIILYGFGEVFWSFKLRKYLKEHPAPQTNVIDAEYEEVK